MNDTQDIVFGVTGQILFFDCPEGRPSSVESVTVYKAAYSDDDDAEAAVGAASVETNPNTTIDATSGAGQANAHLINVTATTGFATRRRYLVTSVDGYREWFECAEIDAGNSVTAKHPLHNTYASSDTVQSTRIQATVDSTWVADDVNLDDCEGPNPAYRVRWVYVVSGATYVADSYFTLVRYAGRNGVRPQDVEMLSPGWLDRLPTDHVRDQGQRLIDDAHRAVRIDLHQIWTDDAMMANAEIVDELTRYRCVELTELARVMSGGGTPTTYEVARVAYHSRFDALAKVTSKTPTRDRSGATTIRPAVGITRR